MIAGFFMFQNNSYKSVLRHTWKRIGIPLILFSVFCFYFRDWLAEGDTLLQSLYHSREEYAEVVQSLLAWSNPIGHTSHLWYLYIYILLMLVFPVLRSFVTYLEGNPGRMKCFLLLTFGGLIVNDISCNRLGAFSHHGINALIPAVIEVLWGYILYRSRHKFQTRRYAAVSLTAFFGLNLIRAFLQMWKFQFPQPDNYLLYWHSSFGVLCSVCIIVFCFAAVKGGVRSGAFIRYAASYTFPVYLLHMVVRDILRRFHIPTGLYSQISRFLGGFWGEILYTIVIVLLIFVLSFILAVILRKIGKCFTALAGIIKTSIG